jgi:hypothetical protein
MIGVRVDLGRPSRSRNSAQPLYAYSMDRLPRSARAAAIISYNTTPSKQFYASFASLQPASNAFSTNLIKQAACRSVGILLGIWQAGTRDLSSSGVRMLEDRPNSLTVIQ